MVIRPTKEKPWLLIREPRRWGVEKSPDKKKRHSKRQAEVKEEVAKKRKDAALKEAEKKKFEIQNAQQKAKEE